MVAQNKITEVQNLTELIQKNKVIGIANVRGIPAKQMQQMRASLRGKINLKISKNRLLFLALKEANKTTTNIEKLIDTINDQSAIIFTEMNPFKLYKELENTKTSAPAKGGEIAPVDIMVPKGETSFKPGPIVGDLQQAGIPAAIEKGKVVIKKDKVLVKEGEEIPKIVAQMLTRLEIFPMVIGLDLKSVYEDGTIFGLDVLAIDETEITNNIGLASAQTFNLAMFINYLNKTTITPLIQKAHSNAFNLAINGNIITKYTVKNLFSKAHNQMLALASNIDDGLDDELKGILSGSKTEKTEVEPQDAKKEKVEEVEEKEETSDEDAMEGLGALFG